MAEERQRHDAEMTGTVMIEWKLFAQIYCVPSEMDEAEEQAFVQQVKDDMGSDFKHCPDIFIRDRLVGGIRCPFNDSRRHVVHAAARYGFQAAAMRHYWGLPAWVRAGIVAVYEASAAESDLWVGDGPFTDRRET